MIKNIEGNLKLAVKRRCISVVLESEGGKYGLGLRGGADTAIPIMISRIAADSSAFKDSRIQVIGKAVRQV